MSTRLHEIARQTVAITEAGEYSFSPKGAVRIAESVAAAVKGTDLRYSDRVIYSVGLWRFPQ